MKLILKKLKMKNFKGIRDLEITFDKKETSIFGANATGKTSIFDAFVWLLFDKDSTNRTQFEIKTLDKNGNVIHGLEHSVEAIIEIDGKETSFKKIYKEKWTKRRGESTKQLTGHVTDFFIDDIPVKKSEYQQRINEIIDEKIFKLVTNPLYFNEQLHWTERRKLLLEIVGDVSNDEIIKSKRSLSKIEEFLKDKEIDEFKKMISYKKKKLNDEIKTIPIRIDEINQSLADYNLDFKEIEKNIEILNKQLEEIENKILDESKIYEENSKIKSKIYEKQNELQKIQYEKQLNQEAPKRELEEQLRRIKYEIKNIQSNVQDFENEIERLQEKEKDYKE
ncbi:Structural maintenance of chromosome-like protein, partial [Marinitoga phage MPV1]